MLLLKVPTQKPAHTSTNTHTHMLPISDHVNEHVIRFVFLCISQGSKGTRQCTINLCTSPMMIYKLIPSVDYKLCLTRLDT